MVTRESGSWASLWLGGLGDFSAPRSPSSPLPALPVAGGSLTRDIQPQPPQVAPGGTTDPAGMGPRMPRSHQKERELCALALLLPFMLLVAAPGATWH